MKTPARAVRRAVFAARRGRRGASTASLRPVWSAEPAVAVMDVPQNGQSPSGLGVGGSLPQNSMAPTASGPLPGPALSAPASSARAAAAPGVSIGGAPSAG
jgi:hypothetical protein